MAVRISIGGFKQIGNNGYITYRGNVEDVKLLLANAINAISKLEKEPEISPDEGKQFS